MAQRTLHLPALLSGSLFFGLLVAGPLPGRAAPSASPGVPVDLLTLKQALAPLSKAGGLSISSTFAVSGQQPGMTFSFHNQMQITARRPHRFHVDLTRDNGPGTKQHYVLVSNGTKVWTYNAATNKYSVMSFAAFDKSDEEIFCEGLAAGILYLGEGFTLPQALQSITTADSAAVLASMKKEGIVLTETVQTVGGENSAVYRMSIKQSLVIDLFVNRDTKQLSAIEIQALDKGMQIGMRENISQIAAVPSMPLSSFAFSPPPGSIRSADVSIGP